MLGAGGVSRAVTFALASLGVEKIFLIGFEGYFDLESAVLLEGKEVELIFNNSGELIIFTGSSSMINKAIIQKKKIAVR